MWRVLVCLCDWFFWSYSVFDLECAADLKCEVNTTKGTLWASPSNPYLLWLHLWRIHDVEALRSQSIEVRIHSGVWQMGWVVTRTTCEVCVFAELKKKVNQEQVHSTNTTVSSSMRTKSPIVACVNYLLAFKWRFDQTVVLYSGTRIDRYNLKTTHNSQRLPSDYGHHHSS